MHDLHTHDRTFSCPYRVYDNMCKPPEIIHLRVRFIKETFRARQRADVQRPSAYHRVKLANTFGGHCLILVQFPQR